MEKDPVLLGLHPLGGISITVYDKDGGSTMARLSLGQSSMLNTHLEALNTILIQAAIAADLQQQMELNSAQGKLFVPGTN